MRKAVMVIMVMMCFAIRLMVGCDHGLADNGYQLSAVPRFYIRQLRTVAYRIIDDENKH